MPNNMLREQEVLMQSPPAVCRPTGRLDRPTLFPASLNSGSRSSTTVPYNRAIKKLFAFLLLAAGLFLYQPVTAGTAGWPAGEAAAFQTPYTGTVLDSAGNPLAGATISVKGSSKAVMSGEDGKFSIDARPGDVLVINYVGYKPVELKAGANTQLRVRMQKSGEDLDEVVVVGYGTQKRTKVVGSVAQIQGKELKTAPTATLSSMLQGRLPGLVSRQPSGQPGSDGANLSVRGLNTLGSNGVLVIVDGVERPFPQINPDEVESISILKDAASAAVYGVRGSAGVILVTTKKGTSGKPSINYNSSIALSTNTNFPKFLDGPGYAYWYNKAQEMDGVAEASRRFTADEIERIKNGDPQGIFGNTDWFDLLFRKSAPIYTNNLSMSGGSDRVKFFASIGSYNQLGIIDRTSYDRYNIRLNLDAKISDRLTASVWMAARKNDTREPGLTAGVGNTYASIFSQALMSYPFLPAYTASGMPVGSPNAGNGNQNPLAARDNSGLNHIRQNRFEGSMALKYDLPWVDGLNLKMNVAYDKNHTMQKRYLLPYLLSVYNLASRQYAESYARHALTGTATLNQWFTEGDRLTFQPSVNYAKSFGKHSVSGMVLYEYMRDDNSSLSGGRRGYPITDIMDLTYGEEVINDLVKGGHNMFHRAGFATRLTYDYANTYLVELTGRADATPYLPSYNRWGYFPGIALGWRISNEKFFKKSLPFVDNLKIRASAGILGNDGSVGYAFLRTVSMGASPVVMIGDKTLRSLDVTNVPNDKLKWETTTTYNFGFESSLWNGLLGVDLDVFYMVTRDVLQNNAGMAPSLGGWFNSRVNYGIVDNRGFELVLSHRNHIGEINYNLRGNVSWARNKVIRAKDDANAPAALRLTGHSIGVKYGFVADGLFQTDEEIANSPVYGPTLPGDIRLKDLNGDGRITWDQDRTIIGRSSTPEMLFGFNIGAGYKGFDLNLFFQGAALADVALGGYYSDKGLYDNTFYTMPFYNDGNSPKYLLEGSWTPENRNAKYPRLSTLGRTNGGKFSNWWVKDASYVRLKSAQIGYTLPSSLIKRAKIQNIRVFASGSNLFTISGLKYLDPEMPDVNQGYYPQQRLYEFGISVNF